MSPTFFPSLFFFFFFFLFSLLLTSLSFTHNYTQDCKPKNCGALINVTFPFWIRSLQPAYCGYPAFELQCDNGIPKFSIPEEDFHVLDISYEKQTLTISMAKFTSTDDCLFPYYNLSFALTPFTISSLNRELIFVYNCSEARDGFVQTDCLKNRSYAYLGGSYRVEESEGLLGPCFTVVMPVLGSAGARADKYHQLLANGFLLNWIAPDCSECLSTNGQCGYDNNSSNFMCICRDRPHLKNCSIIAKSEEKNLKAHLAIGLATAGGLSFIILCSLFFLLYRRCKKKQNLFNRSTSFEISKSEYENIPTGKSPIFSYEELYEATNGFDTSKELGDGGFGTVYKGKLKDGRVVAVKRFYENNYKRLEQFENEVRILSLLRHQNLVTLYGCTSRRSRELLLVYEFVSNGTVADHLHGSRSLHSPLSWPVRLSIAIDTADALSYLHSIEPQIIHRDVKTTNILLDDGFRVKVADFGLSRLFPLDATHVSTAPQGTPGYVDPEYHQFYQLTDRSDVYSFGVVLMELISSLPAVDISRERSEVNLASLAIRRIQAGELHKFVDEKLGYDLDYRIKLMIGEVAGLGLWCLQAEGGVRPGIKEVVEILRGIEKAGRYVGEGCAGVAVEGKEEERLLKCVSSPCSPNAVAVRWLSTSSHMTTFSA